MINTLQLLRTNPAHMGSSPLTPLQTQGINQNQAGIANGTSIGSPSLTSFQEQGINQTDLVNGTTIGSPSLTSLQTQGINQTGLANRTTFETYLLDAVSYVNDKQQASTNISQQLIVNPDSVNVHDVTTAMAEANLSLSLAQNVINRLTQSWSEITSTR